MKLVSMTSAVTQQQPDAWYAALLGLAEHFRTSNPPDVKQCIHCLQTVFTFKPPPNIEARTHLQIGTVLSNHTKNIDLALSHVDRAWTISQSIQSYEDVTYEAASLLGQLYEKQSRIHEATVILRSAVDSSPPFPYWHCRLLFQLAQLHMQEGDYVSAAALLSRGADYAASNRSEFTKILFLLSKGMVLLVEKKLVDVHAVLGQAGNAIEQWAASSVHQKESLKVFFLVLQVCHYLMCGQVKTVKPALKQLQQSIQTITSLHLDDEPMQHSNPIELFQWLPKEHMCILVYLVTVMHSMQAGYMEKAQKYTDKAFMQIEKLRMLDSHPLLSAFQVMLFEHIIMCRLITGNKTAAIQEIFHVCQICQQQPRLMKAHRLQIHALLGLYAMSINCMEAAEAQFKTALMSSDRELWVFVSLNLALVYLRTNRHDEFMAVLNTVEPESLSNTSSYSLCASGFYVKGLQAFFQSRHHDAKRYLRETLKMANAEDLNRLTACSLVLLGHIFLSLGNSQEAVNMVIPAMQLAGKIPDVHVQLWASALLKDLYHALGNPQGEAESYRMHDSFSQMLLKDHFQSTQLSEHRLIEWTGGPCPFYIFNAPPMHSSSDCLAAPGWTSAAAAGGASSHQVR